MTAPGVGPTSDLNAPRLISAPAAFALLEAAYAGSVEVLGALEGAPVMLVDLDQPSPGPLRVPPLMPAIVIGVSRSGGDDGRTGIGGGLDVLIGGSAATGTVWVGTDDVDDEISALLTAIYANPIASVTLAQVLRVGEGCPVTTGLSLESLAYSTLQAGPEFAAWDGARRPPVRGPAEPDPVLVERRGDSLHVILNRPRVHNAYNAAMRDALCDALSMAAADPSVETVQLSGAGPSFCSGGDLKEFGSREEPASAQLIRTGRSPARLLSVLSDRVTAHVHGFCVGSGMELPAFAGRVIADPGATFRLPEIPMGLIPGAGGTASLPRRIGRHRTAWMGFAARPIDAPTALQWGLVDALVPRTEAPG